MTVLPEAELAVFTAPAESEVVIGASQVDVHSIELVEPGPTFEEEHPLFGRKLQV